MVSAARPPTTLITNARSCDTEKWRGWWAGFQAPGRNLFCFDDLFSFNLSTVDHPVCVASAALAPPSAAHPIPEITQQRQPYLLLGTSRRCRGKAAAYLTFISDTS